LSYGQDRAEFAVVTVDACGSSAAHLCVQRPRLKTTRIRVSWSARLLLRTVLLAIQRSGGPSPIVRERYYHPSASRQLEHRALPARP
jgi:hypothetical protein